MSSRVSIFMIVSRKFFMIERVPFIVFYLVMRVVAIITMCLVGVHGREKIFSHSLNKLASMVSSLDFIINF